MLHSRAGTALVLMLHSRAGTALVPMLHSRAGTGVMHIHVTLSHFRSNGKASVYIAYCTGSGMLTRLLLLLISKAHQGKRANVNYNYI